MYELTIDGREPPSLFAVFDNGGVKYSRVNLDVGDFQIATDDRIAVIVERKTWGDLVSSLTGQRLSEQTARIVDKCRETGARPVLLVEHDRVVDWAGSTGNISNKFVDCTILKYALEGFSVVHSKNVAHTRDVVTWMLERCRVGKIPTFVPDFTFRGEAGGKKFRKKDYGKPWEIMLTAVRGVSKAKAKEISSKFPNAMALSAALEAGEDLGVKGIGKKLCADMREALVG